MNDLQKKAFELLQTFVGVCEKWDIPYYLVCGSALGAVKYGGFIPWDDDIDVGLLREDYEKFLSVAPGELPEWCFLQNYMTDPMFPHTTTKLRNSNTTFIEDGVAHLAMNHGIYLDVFPIDGYPSGHFGKLIFEVTKKWNEWIALLNMKHSKTLQIRIRNQVLRLLGYHKKTNQACCRLENLYRSYAVQNSELWCNYGNGQGKLEYAPRWHYGEGAWVTFEGLPVRIPENYDAYLTQKYGNWRAELPQERQKSHHVGIIIDTENSYTNYTGENGKKEEC